MSKRRTKGEKSSMSDKIIANMQSGMPMRKACQDVGLAPSSFIEWCDADPLLAERYARARERLLDMMAEEILEISDEAVPSTAQGSLDSAAVQQQRMRIDTRKWLMSKLAPQKYGERQHVEVSGKLTLESLVADE